MHEKPMEEVVSPENYGKALKAVIGSAGYRRDENGGVERTPTNGHLLQHWPKIHAKLRIAGRSSGWRDAFDGIYGNASGCGGTNRKGEGAGYAAESSRGAWRIAGTGSLQTALSNGRLRRHGFLMPSDLASG
jgi:hypothetical protein